MILILDNNEFRRKDLAISLFMKNYLVSVQSLKDMEKCTKPALTVYMNPLSSEIERIKKEETYTLIVKSNFSSPFPDWMHVIPNDGNVIKNIVNIYNEVCVSKNRREIYGIICFEGNDVALGGEYLRLNKKQMDILKLLIYNPKKEFAFSDIKGYLQFSDENDYSFYKFIETINKKCKSVNREPLISYKMNKYRINPILLIN